MEDSADITTSPNSESHEKKGPSSRIKQNHPLKDIVGDMNELILRKRTVDKCVANFMSYSCYLSQVEPTKIEKALQDESGLKQCMMNCFSFREMMFGPWYLDWRVNTSSAPSGYSTIRLMRKAM